MSKKEPKIIYIYSRTGGSGKSSLSMQLARYLKQKLFQKVLLIDASLNKTIFMCLSKLDCLNENQISIGNGVEVDVISKLAGIDVAFFSNSTYDYFIIDLCDITYFDLIVNKKLIYCYSQSIVIYPMRFDFFSIRNFIDFLKSHQDFASHIFSLFTNCYSCSNIPNIPNFPNMPIISQGTSSLASDSNSSERNYLLNLLFSCGLFDKRNHLGEIDWKLYLQPSSTRDDENNLPYQIFFPIERIYNQIKQVHPSLFNIDNWYVETRKTVGNNSLTSALYNLWKEMLSTKRKVHPLKQKKDPIVYNYFADFVKNNIWCRIDLGRKVTSYRILRCDQNIVLYSNVRYSNYIPLMRVNIEDNDKNTLKIYIHCRCNAYKKKERESKCNFMMSILFEYFPKTKMLNYAIEKVCDSHNESCIITTSLDANQGIVETVLLPIETDREIVQNESKTLVNDFKMDDDMFSVSFSK